MIIQFLQQLESIFTIKVYCSFVIVYDMQRDEFDVRLLLRAFNYFIEQSFCEASTSHLINNT